MEEIRNQIKLLYNVAMGALIEKYAANGIFFTNEEFKAHEAEILELTHLKTKLDELTK